jgi:hypothetical protein
LADPKLFDCSPKDDAFHPDPRPGFFEWWYFDGLFDDQSSFVLVFHRNGVDAAGSIQLSLYDPDGAKTHVEKSFSPAETFTSSETCDVRMGSNFLRGEYPKREMRFRSGDMGCDLVMTNVVQGVRFPPDGVTPFTEDRSRYLGWSIPQPRAEITGEVTEGGKSRRVHGVGYHDHNWGVGGGGQGERTGTAMQQESSGLAGLYDFWYWGRLYLPNHTFVYSVGRMNERLGHLPVNSLIAFQGPTLATVSTKIGYEEKGLTLDESNGVMYPQELVIKPEHRRIQGDISLKLLKVMETTMHGSKGHGYFRFLADCRANLDFDGEKVTSGGTVIHELMKA